MYIEYTYCISVSHKVAPCIWHRLHRAALGCLVRLPTLRNLPQPLWKGLLRGETQPKFTMNKNNITWSVTPCGESFLVPCEDQLQMLAVLVNCHHCHRASHPSRLQGSGRNCDSSKWCLWDSVALWRQRRFASTLQLKRDVLVQLSSLFLSSQGFLWDRYPM